MKLKIVLLALSTIAIATFSHQATAGTATCGVYSKYLGGLGVIYDKPVTQCSGSATIADGLSLNTFISAPFKGGWWNNSGSEIDTSLSYVFRLGDISMIAAGGFFFLPGNDIAFGSLRTERSFAVDENLTLTPFVKGQWNETLGNAFPNAGSVEPGLDASFKLDVNWTLDAGSRLRFVTDGTRGLISSLGINYTLTDTTSIRLGGEMQGEFRSWKPEFVTGLTITKSW